MIYVSPSERFNLASCALRRSEEAKARLDFARYNAEREAFWRWMNHGTVCMTMAAHNTEAAYWRGYQTGVSDLAEKLDQIRAI